MDNKKLKVLYTHRTRGSDVESVHIMGIVNALKEKGHEVDLLSVPGASTQKKNKLISKFFDFISLHLNQVLFEFAEFLYNFILYINLVKKFKNQKYDFIYERYALNTFATVLFANKMKIPILLEVNDATGIKRTRNHKLEFISKRFENWIFCNVDSVITISSKFVEIIEDRIGKNKKICFIPNAIDEKTFDIEKYPINYDKKVVVGFVGSFAQWHGVDMLLEVIPDILKTNKNIKFLIVGSGVTFQRFKLSIDSMGFSNEVELTGKVPHEMIPGYLAKMNVGVIPDSNEYGSPMKLFEYMAMNAVPVAPDLPPILDVIENEVNGLIFNRRDTNSLSKVLINICEHEELRKKITFNARVQVLNNHLWKHNAEKIIDIYYRVKNDGLVKSHVQKN
ncbi:glycosyltransferase family 4 protein [Desulfatiferula olefinivorans]